MEISFPDFSYLLHALRTVALREMSYRPDTMISVGCAGSWYFDWIHQSFHLPIRHIGIEFYARQPDELPNNVEWIQNTASNMYEIRDNEADLLFSGQNVEHLLPGEIADFFVNAHRVIKNNGIIVLDSPNREQASKLTWSHPEHFIEFTPDEISEILVGAGFSAPHVKGIWLCEDPRTARTLPLDSAGHELLWRCLAAAANPACSFIWWAEATRLDMVPDREHLRSLVERIAQGAWSDRVRRFQTLVGEALLDDCGSWFVAPKGVSGPLMYGPYVPLEKGAYSVIFVLRIGETDRPEDEVASVDVLAGGESGVLGVEKIRAIDVEVDRTVRRTIRFALSDTTFGLQFRVLSSGATDVAALRDVSLTRESDDASESVALGAATSNRGRKIKIAAKNVISRLEQSPSWRFTNKLLHKIFMRHRTK